MSKYTLFMLIIAFIMALTVVANSLEGVTAGGDVIQAPGTGVDEDSSSIFGYLATFFRIMTFQLHGVPNVVNAIIFTPILFGIGFMITDVLKDLVPLT